MVLAGIPSNVTVLVLGDELKPVPVITTDVPIGPTPGLRPVTESASVTVNGMVLLVTPSSATTSGPLVAPDGTVSVTLVALQDETFPAKPLN